MNCSMRIMVAMTAVVCLLYLVYRRKNCGFLMNEILFLSIGFIMGALLFFTTTLIHMPEDKTRGEIAGRVVEIGVGNTQYLKLKPYYVNGNKMDGSLLLYGETDSILPGQLVTTSTEIAPYDPATNPGQFDLKAYYKARGIYMSGFFDGIEVLDQEDSSFFTAIIRCKARFMRIICENLNDKDAGVLCAVLLGDKSYLDQDLKIKYQQNGVAHMLAISGLHISLIGGVLYRLLKRLGLPFQISGIISFVIMIPYILMIGSAVASIRATIMLIILIGADIKGRSYDFLTSASISGMLILFESPLYLFDAGFLLSFSAVLGIGLFLPELEKLRGSVLWSGIGIWLCILPVQLSYFYEVNLCSILINLIIIPLLPVLIGCGFLGILSGISIFFPIIHIVLRFYENLLIFKGIIIGKPTILQIIIYLVGLYIVTLFLKKRVYVLSVLVILLSLLVIAFPKIHPFSYYMLDVGQGECNVIFLPDNQYMMVDGGSSNIKGVGNYRILPFLKSMGISGLDYVVITHFDEDHYNGIAELIEQDYRIEHVIVSSQLDDSDQEYMEFQSLCNHHDIPVETISSGDCFKQDEFAMNCLFPTETFAGDKNEASLTFLLEYQGFRALLTGDLENAGEEALIRELLPAVNLLKVGHHGSKNATGDDLLEKITPDIAFISCGRNNRYGHPHRETTNRLDDHQVSWYTTATNGALWYSKGRYMCYTNLHENNQRTH